MKKNKSNALNLFTIFILSLFIISCAEDDNEVDNNDLRIVATESLRFGNETFTKLSIEDIKKGNDQINKIINEYSSKSTETFLSIDDLAELYEEHLAISKEETYSFFNMILENKELLLQPGAKEELIQQMIIVGNENYESSQNKWLFQSLYGMFGGDSHCSVGVLAAFADTVVLGAAMVVTAPTGVGAVVSGIGLASSYSSLIYQAVNCH